MPTHAGGPFTDLGKLLRFDPLDVRRGGPGRPGLPGGREPCRRPAADLLRAIAGDGRSARRTRWLDARRRPRVDSRGARSLPTSRTERTPARYLSTVRERGTLR